MCAYPGRIANWMRRNAKMDLSSGVYADEVQLKAPDWGILVSHLMVSHLTCRPLWHGIDLPGALARNTATLPVLGGQCEKLFSGQGFFHIRSRLSEVTQRG